MLSSRSVEVLACPLCKGKLVITSDGTRLICRHCDLAFPVKNGIPKLLADAAEKVENEKTG